MQNSAVAVIKALEAACRVADALRNLGSRGYVRAVPLAPLAISPKPQPPQVDAGLIDGGK